MAKKIGTILLAAGILMLIAAILFAFAIGGGIVFILLISSVIINSVGITLIRGKY